MTEAEIKEVLGKIPVPGTNKDLVYLKMVNNIAIQDNNVSFDITIAHAMMKAPSGQSLQIRNF